MKNNLKFALQAKAAGKIGQSGKFALINRAGIDRYEAEVWYCAETKDDATAYARPRKLRVISSAHDADFSVGEKIPVEAIGRTYPVHGYTA